jgi:hypothetical protein
MGVELHIEELVLHGFAPGDRRRIAGEVERELARLIGEADFARARGGMSIERMNGPAFKVKAGAKPEAAGAQIAQSLYRSLRQGASASVTPPSHGGRRP